MNDQFVFELLIVLMAIALLLTSALMVAAMLVMLDLRQALRQLLRAPEVQRDSNGRRLRERL